MSRFGGEPLKIQVVCPQNGTDCGRPLIKVLKPWRSHIVLCFFTTRRVSVKCKHLMRFVLRFTTRRVSAKCR